MSLTGKRDTAKKFLATFEKFILCLFVTLVVIALVLAFAHHVYWQYGIDKENIAASFFDLDSESTVCAWFASIQWFLIGVFAFSAFYFERLFGSGKRFRIWWLIIGCVFIVASVDEASIIHETMGELLKPVMVGHGLGGSIWSYFAESPWLVFYAIPLGVFIVASLWFLSDRLKARKSALYLCALGFALFIVALLIEFVQGLPPDKLLPIAIKFNTTCPWFYRFSVLIEETFENIGAASVLVSFLFYNHHLLNTFFWSKDESLSSPESPSDKPFNALTSKDNSH